MKHPSDDRTACCIVGCKRTIRGIYCEAICGKHWKLIPRARRRVHSRLKRYWFPGPPSGTLYERERRSWENLKRIAQSRAAGI